jgi:bifunctional non-homologous end joining protein LigD
MAATGRPKSQQQYVRPKMPGFVEYQHPRLVDHVPAGRAWLHELKYDGYRMQVQVRGGKVSIFTRNGHDWTAKLPDLVAAAGELPDCILDGELCAVDAKGMPSFSALRSAIGRGKGEALIYYAFDLLWSADDDMRPYSLETRKGVLARMLEDHGWPRIRFVDHYDKGATLFESACRLKLEGVVSKRRSEPYRPGRSDAWRKVKCRPGQEVVIGGWRQAPLGKFEGLYVGVYEGGKLTYAGRVKNGFAREAELRPKLKALEVKRSPFEAGDWPKINDPAVHWVKPQLVAALQIEEWTSGGALRHASYKGLREDKDPREVVRELAEG